MNKNELFHYSQIVSHFDVCSICWQQTYLSCNIYIRYSTHSDSYLMQNFTDIKAAGA
jgi:hypothetical protein